MKKGTAKLYNRFEIMEDELLISYAFRLANANSVSLSQIVTYSDVYRMGIDLHPKNVRGKTVTIEHTGHHYLRPFAANWRRIVSSDYSKLLVPRVSEQYKEVNVCPVCQQEETKRMGFWIIHVSHQLPGLHICPKHTCRFIRYRLYRNELVEKENIKSEIDLASELEYSAYYEKLIQCTRKVHLSCKDTKRAIRNRASEMAIDVNSLKINVSSRSTSSLDAETALKIMMKLWSDPTKIEWNILNQQKLPKGFKLKENESYGVIKVECQKCGSEFYTSYDLLNALPVCQSCATSKNALNAVAKKLEDEEYEITDYISPAGNKELGSFKLIHTCGRESEIMLVNLVYDDKRCLCRKDKYISDVKRRLQNKTGGTFEILDRDGKFATIRHKECGRVFVRQYAKFYHHPKCPFCTPSARAVIASLDEANAKIERLTNGEFSIEEYHGAHKHAVFRHKKCGKTFSTSYVAFLRRTFCRCCGSYHDDPNFYEKNKSKKKISAKEVLVCQNHHSKES